MMIFYFLYFLNILFNNFYYIRCFNWREWEDPLTSKFYDFSILERSNDNPWVYIKESGSFSIVHKFNFGNLVNKNCFGKTGSIIESYEITGRVSASCTVLGHYEDRNVDFIDKNNLDKGVVLAYQSKEPCLNPYNSNVNNFRKVKFFLYCNNKQDNNVNIYNIII
jgi:hypothetical protein